MNAMPLTSAVAYSTSQSESRYITQLATSAPDATDTHVAYLRLVLASFIRQAFAIAENIRPVHAQRELSPALERVARAAALRRRAWLAWTDDSRTWFVAAEFANDAPTSGNALRTYFHDDDGRLAASATWMRQADGRWQLWDR